MRVKTTPPIIDVVKREDKEGRVTAFILEFLQSAAPADGACLLIARAVTSPVFRAVAAMAESGQLKAPVRLILSSIEAGDAGGVPAAAQFAETVRLTRNSRLLDAHEQLVLGPHTAWIGDCMRREPEKRDAWECYAAACSETARRAAVSFERLWQMCEPLKQQAAAASEALPEYVLAGAETASPARPITPSA